jgi:hemerythrin-like domain-containing protein
MPESSGAETTTGVLRDEHQLILGVVEVLDRNLNVTDDRSLDLIVIDRCISFFRLFVDACHHGKEEDLLFPELIEHGMPGDAGPIAVMLSEHVQGRSYVRGMSEAMPDAKSGSEEALAALRSHAEDYINLIREHIGKENHILFTMADEMVVGEACRALCGSYDATYGRQFEGNTKGDLERIAADLMKG